MGGASRVVPGLSGSSPYIQVPLLHPALESPQGVPWQLLLPVSYCPLRRYQASRTVSRGRSPKSCSPAHTSGISQPPGQPQTLKTIQGNLGGIEVDVCAWQGPLGHSTAVPSQWRVEWRKDNRMLKWLHSGEREGRGVTSSGRQSGD